MRIGIFTECYKPIINGVVNSIIGFKLGLEKLDHEVFVFCPTYRNFSDDPKDKNIIHCKSTAIPGKSGYHFIWPIEKSIKDIAKTMDIIHVQHPFIMGERASSVAKEFNLPLVFTNHTQYEQYAHYIPISKTLVNKSIEWYIKGFSKKTDLIIAPAPGIVKILRKYGVKTPIEIVPNGIDVRRFEKKISQIETDKIRKKYKINPDDKILVFTGRIAEEKNLTFLINAFSQLIIKNPNVFLMLVGGGPELEHFQNLINQSNLSEKVIITDYIPYSEIPKYLATGYVYVTASKSEVHPLTVLEGLAAKLPMVIVNAPGTGDIVTDNIDGLVARDKPADFVAKINQLLHDRDLYKRLSLGARKTAEKYSYLATSKKIVSIYQQAIIIHLSKKRNTKKT